VFYLSSEQAEIAKQASPRTAMEENARAKKNPSKRSSAFQIASKYSSLDYQEVDQQAILSKIAATFSNNLQVLC
jgi:hypothetical protein